MLHVLDPVLKACSSNPGIAVSPQFSPPIAVWRISGQVLYYIGYIEAFTFTMSYCLHCYINGCYYIWMIYMDYSYKWSLLNMDALYGCYSYKWKLIIWMLTYMDAIKWMLLNGC